jgi:nucleoside-diphosphate-sugar epimerase
MNPVADNHLAKELLGWEPEVPFVDGLHRTIDWCFPTKDYAVVAERLDTALIER